MASNCCPTQYNEGGTIGDTTVINSTIVNSEISNSTITGATITGNTSLDNAAASSIADQLCGFLDGCVSNIIEGNTFNDVTLAGSTINTPIINGGSASNMALTDTTLSGNISLRGDITANAQAVESICNIITPCVLDAVSNNTITAPHLSSASIDSSAITGSVISNSTLQNTTVEGVTTFTGDLAFAGSSLYTLCEAMQPCMDTAISSAIENSFDAARVAAVFTRCDGSVHSVGTAIPSCNDVATSIDTAIATALSDIPISDTVKGLTFNPATDIIRLETQLSDGTIQYWEINLSKFLSELVVDGDTIEGNGTADDPLRVVITEAAAPTSTVGDDVPTVIFGERDAILGRPTRWIQIGDARIPAYDL